MSSYSLNDLVKNAIRTYENHPSINKISETIAIALTFYFSGVNKVDIEKSIANLNSYEAETFKNIPTKCLKVTSCICSVFLAAIWNQELILNKKF